jgi:hydrogenase small subunit
MTNKRREYMGNSATEEYTVIWIAGAACTGCSVSVLNSVSPTIKNVLIDEVIPGKHLNLRFHPAIMAGQGKIAVEILDQTRKGKKGDYILVIEGAIPISEKSGYCMVAKEDMHEEPFISQVLSLGSDALAVIALGSCAAFGGIPAGNPNPTTCRSVKEVFESHNISVPLINIPGCPPHPDWFMGTVARIMLLGLPKPEDLDEFLRPKAFYGNLIHENCERRAYYDEGKFAKKFGDPGCLYELGCKGPVTHADCPIRRWNNGTNWCIGAGSPCIGCCEPGFPDLVSPFYEKIVISEVK